MGRIKNTTQYPIKEVPSADDYVIGTNSENNGESVNFRVGSLTGDVVLASTKAEYNASLTDGDFLFVGDVDLSGYVTLATDQTIAGLKTFTNNNSFTASNTFSNITTNSNPISVLNTRVNGILTNSSATASGAGIVSDGAIGFSGKVFSGRNNSIETFSVNKEGDIVGTSLLATGGSIKAGVDGTAYGQLELFGDSANQGGIIDIYQAPNFDTDTNFWRVYAQGSNGFNIQAQGGAGGNEVVFAINPTTRVAYLPNITVADIDTHGINAIVTREWVNAQGFGGGGGSLDLAANYNWTGNHDFAGAVTSFNSTSTTFDALVEFNGTVNFSGGFDAGDNAITGIGDGILATDGVNLGQVETLIAAGAGASKHIELLGDGASLTYNINHNKGTRSLTFSLFNTTTLKYDEGDYTYVDNNNTLVTFVTAPTSNQYEITII